MYNVMYIIVLTPDKFAYRRVNVPIVMYQIRYVILEDVAVTQTIN